MACPATGYFLMRAPSAWISAGIAVYPASPATGVRDVCSYRYWLAYATAFFCPIPPVPSLPAVLALFTLKTIGLGTPFPSRRLPHFHIQSP